MSNTTRQALTCKREVGETHGRSTNTWQRELKTDLKKMGYTWSQIAKKASDRDPLSTAYSPKGVLRHKKEEYNSIVFPNMLHLGLVKDEQ